MCHEMKHVLKFGLNQSNKWEQNSSASLYRRPPEKTNSSDEMRIMPWSLIERNELGGSLTPLSIRFDCIEVVDMRLIFRTHHHTHSTTSVRASALSVRLFVNFIQFRLSKCHELQQNKFNREKHAPIYQFYFLEIWTPNRAFVSTEFSLCSWMIDSIKGKYKILATENTWS